MNTASAFPAVAAPVWTFVERSYWLCDSTACFLISRCGIFCLSHHVEVTKDRDKLEWITLLNSKRPQLECRCL